MPPEKYTDVKRYQASSNLPLLGAKPFNNFALKKDGTPSTLRINPCHIEET
jgi:hypothetical protein